MWYSFEEAFKLLRENYLNPIHCKLMIWKSGHTTVEGFGNFTGNGFNGCSIQGIVKQVFIK